MRRSFWKATLISLAAYITVILIGFGAGFQYTLFLIAALQVSWTPFCAIRAIQLRRRGGHRADAPEYDQESYRFALGGALSSIALLLVTVVLTQAV
jgi:uncharacterized membrane protein YdfJ with MMPL/SSD domain